MIVYFYFTMLDLKRLRLLRELDARGTIGAVALALDYSPSAVSQQLALLEKEAGVPLLERAGRNVRLTAAAQTLVTHTDALLARIPSLEQHGCSYGCAGGFVRRLREDGGTWMGHVMEHVAIELQCLAGTPVAYGKTRGHDLPKGQYHVIYSYEEEVVGLEAAQLDVEYHEHEGGHHLDPRTLPLMTAWVARRIALLTG